jgi:acetyl esterase/lipase
MTQLSLRAFILAVLAAVLLACRGTAAQDPKVLRDLAYGPHEDQRLDVYLPENPKDAVVIFMVHGGGWRIGDKEHSRVVDNKAARWLPQGYIFISANNRLVPDADPAEQADDLGKALAFAQKTATDWGGDPDRFILMGHSAGAHLVSLVSAAPEIATQQGAKPWLGTVALDSAAFDVVAVMEGRHFRLYDRAFGDDRALWERASPLHRLERAPPPMLLVCSSRRRESCSQAETFARKSKGLGGDVEVLPVDLSHGEINAELGEAGAYTQRVETFLYGLAKP